MFILFRCKIFLSFRVFLGGLVVRILGFHCCGLGSIPGWELRSCKPQQSQKKF